MARSDDRNYDTGYESEGGYSRRRSSVPTQDRYEPQQYGMRDNAARDGYQNDGYAQDYADGRRGQQQYIDYPRQQSYGGGYSDARSRSYNDLSDTVRDDREDRYYDDEPDDRQSRSGRSKDRDRSRSKSRTGSRLSFLQGEDEDGNTELKKWGATLAGAVVGGIAGRTATGKSGKKDNWVPTAIGAVVGGLVAREAEKGFVKRQHEKQLRRESEYDD